MVPLSYIRNLQLDRYFTLTHQRRRYVPSRGICHYPMPTR